MWDKPRDMLISKLKWKYKRVKDIISNLAICIIHKYLRTLQLLAHVTDKNLIKCIEVWCTGINVLYTVYHTVIKIQ